jgi:YhcH/YjgK/YiaL family protein
MIYGKLADWRGIPGFSNSPVWSAAFQWLATGAKIAAEGYHPLGADGFVARVMAYATRPREQALFEMHRNFIDIQFTLEGGEAIEVTPTEALQPRNDYDGDKDVEFFITPPTSQARVENRQGCFTVLFAGEPHMPQLAIPGIATVRKVVIKVPVHLL